MANVAVVAGIGDKGNQCIFDGYVLAHKLHLETGITNSTVAVWGQDASWLMNMTETVKEWVDVTDADVAASIFGNYGISPSDQNSDDDSPSHSEDGHSLMQRASDIQFLRTLARRSGKVCRVACTDTPGQRTGYFAKPKLDGDAVATLTLNDPENWTIHMLDLEWDVSRPSAVVARQALFSDADDDGTSADTEKSGLDSLGERTLADFVGKPMSVLLAAPVDSTGELTLRAQSVLRDAAWFVRCEGETDVDRLGVVLRAGMLVQLDGLGALHSGKYLVWKVRHFITKTGHNMKFMLTRNAVGPAPAGRRRRARRARRRAVKETIMDTQTLMDVVDRLRNRFFGKYRGVVTDVDASTFRIKAKVPAVLAGQPSGWARACVPFAGDGFGFAFLPEVGSGVWVEFEGGDVSYPIWVGGFWHDGEAPPDATDTVKAIVTKSNQKILIDQDGGSITITDDNNNTVTLDSSGMTLSRGGQQIQISDSEVNVNQGALEVM
ncbi:phage baseplate assembly protein V [Bradyrhizobium niftali]|uniref:phage baseplate assembly protein V n=1 Tax=Bradyrhizobium niftali TaxID=2560055 RepID=UPI00384EFA45